MEENNVERPTMAIAISRPLAERQQNSKTKILPLSLSPLSSSDRKQSSQSSLSSEYKLVQSHHKNEGDHNNGMQSSQSSVSSEYKSEETHHKNEDDHSDGMQSSQSSVSNEYKSEETHHKNEGDHSDRMQSSQSSVLSEYRSEETHHKNEGDHSDGMQSCQSSVSSEYKSEQHSDGMQSSQSSAPTEYISEGRRKCKKDFNSRNGFISPLWNSKWKKEVKVTSAQPFQLRTEERGQIKKQQFMEKIQQILDEEKKHQIPLAQGLPWTTDEPQVLPKPLVKEQTKPLNIKLHTKIRAIERARFDLLNRRRFVGNGMAGNGNVKLGGGGHRALRERQSDSNTNILSLTSSSSSSSCSGYFDWEQSHHKNEGDHSDEMQSSQSSMTSSGGRRKCKKNFNSKRGSVSPPWNMKWEKVVEVTSVQPFTLRTEQRGQIKEQQFMKKIQQILDEEKKLRIPLAQGLPWTTDEPQVLSKPLVKEQTKPLDVKLHTKIRAIERARFNLLMKEKFYLLEQQKIEEERLQKLFEEEEIKMLRKKMIPYAQLMPYFDHPFIPKKSSKSAAIPKEPKFHNIHHTKCLARNFSLHT